MVSHPAAEGKHLAIEEYPLSTLRWPILCVCVLGGSGKRSLPMVCPFAIGNTGLLQAYQ